MFCSVKTDKGNDAVLHLSLRSLNIHFACPLTQVPIRSIKHVLVAKKKRVVQGCKNAVAHSRRATKTWSARTFASFCTSCIL